MCSGWRQRRGRGDRDPASERPRPCPAPSGALPKRRPGNDPGGVGADRARANSPELALPPHRVGRGGGRRRGTFSCRRTGPGQGEVVGPSAQHLVVVVVERAGVREWKSPVCGVFRSRPVSRILSWVTISLGRPLPVGSSGVPGSSAGRVIGTCFTLHRTGFGEPPCHHGAGGLLPHPFTLTAGVSGEFVAGSGLLSVPLSVGFSPPGVSPASCPSVSGLSSDRLLEPARGHPACTLIVAGARWKDRAPANAARTR